MKHVIALFIKTLMIASVLLIVLSVFNNYPASQALWLAIIVSGASYLLGDLFILPMTNNTTATLADFGIGTIVVWWVGSAIYNSPVPLTIALMSALLIGIGEWVFHAYMAKVVLPNRVTL